MGRDQVVGAGTVLPRLVSAGACAQVVAARPRLRLGGARPITRPGFRPLNIGRGVEGKRFSEPHIIEDVRTPKLELRLK